MTNTNSPKFKAGDKIWWKEKVENRAIHEVLFVGKKSYFISSINTPYGCEVSSDIINTDKNYTLYTEPQTVTRWINIYKDFEGLLRTSNRLFETKENALYNKYPAGWIDCIEIIYTEKES